MNSNIIGICPICNRGMIADDPYVDEHHLIPKSQNGKHGPKVLIHRICHDKIHSLWTEPELAGEYNTVDAIVENHEIKKFRKWVSKKPMNYYAKTKKANVKYMKRR